MGGFLGPRPMGVAMGGQAPPSLASLRSAPSLGPGGEK